jgi:hypothetical protein
MKNNPLMWLVGLLLPLVCPVRLLSDSLRGNNLSESEKVVIFPKSHNFAIFRENWPKYKYLMTKVQHPMSELQRRELVPTWYRLQRLGAISDKMKPKAFTEHFSGLPFSTVVNGAKNSAPANVPYGGELEAIKTLLRKDPDWSVEKARYLGKAAPRGGGCKRGSSDSDGSDSGHDSVSSLSGETESDLTNSIPTSVGKSENKSKDTSLADESSKVRRPGRSLKRTKSPPKVVEKKQKSLSRVLKKTKGNGGKIIYFPGMQSLDNFLVQWDEYKRLRALVSSPMSPAQRNELRSTWYVYHRLGALFDKVGREEFIKLTNGLTLMQCLKKFNDYPIHKNSMPPNPRYHYPLDESNNLFEFQPKMIQQPPHSKKAMPEKDDGQAKVDKHDLSQPEKADEVNESLRILTDDDTATTTSKESNI